MCIKKFNSIIQVCRTKLGWDNNYADSEDVNIINDISKQDWINQIIAMGLVMSIEGMNTAVEKLADFVHKENHPKLGFIKDISAGAVTFAALTFIVVFAITYLPYIINRT